MGLNSPPPKYTVSILGLPNTILIDSEIPGSQECIQQTSGSVPAVPFPEEGRADLPCPIISQLDNDALQMELPMKITQQCHLVQNVAARTLLWGGEAP